MRFRAWPLLIAVLAVASSEPAHAQLTLTIEPNPVVGGTVNTVTVTAVFTAPHNGAVIGLSGFCSEGGALTLQPGQTTAVKTVTGPPLVSVQTVLSCHGRGQL